VGYRTNNYGYPPASSNMAGKSTNSKSEEF